MGNSTSIIAMAVVAGFILVFVIVGYFKGFLRSLMPLATLVITIVAASLLAGPTATFLKDKTSVGSWIEKSVAAYIDTKVDDKVELLPKPQQNSLIGELTLPDFIKTDMAEGNTLAKYTEMGVTTFKEYIGSKLSTLGCKALAFIMLGIVIFVAMRIVIAVCKVVSKIPIIRGFNRLLGGLLGLVEAMTIIWAFGILIMALSGTEFGQTALEVIRANVFLNFLYDNNLLLLLVKSVFV